MIYARRRADLAYTQPPKLSANQQLAQFMEEYQRLRAKKSEDAMRQIATVGLVSGALKVEELIRANLGQLADDLIENFNVSTPKENLDKLLAIEEVMERDRSSVDVLMSALEFARNDKSYEIFNQDMRRILKKVYLTIWKLDSITIDFQMDNSQSLLVFRDSFVKIEGK